MIVAIVLVVVRGKEHLYVQVAEVATKIEINVVIVIVVIVIVVVMDVVVSLLPIPPQQ